MKGYNVGLSQKLADRLSKVSEHKGIAKATLIRDILSHRYLKSLGKKV